MFFHGLWGHSYLDGVPIYRITQKHNWNLLLCDLRAQGDSEGKFSTLGVLEKYDCLDWVEWAQNRFGDKNPIFLMGVCPIGRRPWKLGRNWKSTNENPPVYGERYV